MRLTGAILFLFVVTVVRSSVLPDVADSLDGPTAEEGRELPYGITVTNVKRFSYVVQVIYKLSREAIMTGVALNKRFVIFSPKMFYDNLSNLDDWVVISHTHSFTRGKHHEVTKLIHVPNIPQMNGVNDPFVIIRVCPEIRSHIFPVLPRTPVATGVYGHVIQWTAPNVLQRMRKRTTDDENCPVDYDRMLGYENVFCTANDVTKLLCFEVVIPFGVPFITAGNTLSGLLISGECKLPQAFEDYVDIGIYGEDICELIVIEDSYEEDSS